MVGVPLGLGAYKRVAAGEPEVRLENRYVEKNPTNPKEHVSLVGRPGKTALHQFAGGLIRKCFSSPDFMGGDLFVVSGTSLYRYDGTTATLITGTVSNATPPSFAMMKGPGYEKLFISDFSSVQYYSSGGSLTAVAMPGGVTPGNLTAIDGFVLVGVSGGHKFFWIEPGAVIIDALDFASAESNPDALLDMATSGDLVFMMGNATIEVWYPTGDSDAPFAPIEGRVYRMGVMPFTWALLQDSLIFVGSDNVVYQIGAASYSTAPQGIKPISDSGISERIRVRRTAAGTGLLTSVKAWSFTLDTHIFYVLDLGSTGTWLYDLTTQEWCRFYEGPTAAEWSFVNGTMWGQRIIAGDLTTTDVWELLPTATRDPGPVDITHAVTGMLSLRTSDYQSCDVVRVSGSKGQLGSGTTATMNLRFSDDQGQTWVGPFALTLTQSDYTGTLDYRALGSFAAPGRLFEITDTGGLLRIDGCDVNPDTAPEQGQ